MGRDRKEAGLIVALILVTCVQVAFSVRAILDVWNTLTAS
jgi:hypothetical protein